MDFENGFHLILSELQELKQGQEEMREDISELKQGQTALREDIFVMQGDISDLKQDQAEMCVEIAELKENAEQIKENTGFICTLVNGQAVIETKVDDLHEETSQKFDIMFKQVDDIERIVMRNTYDIALLKEAK